MGRGRATAGRGGGGVWHPRGGRAAIRRYRRAYQEFSDANTAVRSTRAQFLSEAPPDLRARFTAATRELNAAVNRLAELGYTHETMRGWVPPAPPAKEG